MRTIVYLVFVLQLQILMVTGFQSVARFCNETFTNSFQTRCVSCARNAQVECPVRAEKLTRDRGIRDCTYNIVYQDREFSTQGCRHSCLQQVEHFRCCDGYWGPNCDRCPGVHGLVCSGHGGCNDTMEGTGVCQCHEGFTGYACEMCVNDTMYGRDCSNDCKCEHGVCDNMVIGSGSCHCDTGYQGDHCDQWIDKCTNLTCDENSRCMNVSGHVMCACNLGYQKTLVNNTCEEINVCEAYTLCADNATCTPTAPNKYNCTCLDGFRGDGYACDPIDPCQTDDGGCVHNSSFCVYTAPGKSECQCKPGFEGYTEGYGCGIINVCVFNSSHCAEHATCNTTGPMQFVCTCHEGYGGDGTECYPNILERVKELNRQHSELKNKLRFAVQLLSRVYDDELRNDGPFTIFVPIDGGFIETIPKFQEFLNDTDRARQVLRQHMIVGAITLQELQTSNVFYTLQGVPARIMVRQRKVDIQYRYRLHGSSNRALLLEPDVQAGNGVIHIISKMLTNSPMTRGNTQESILSLIKAERRYNRLEMLIEAAGMAGEFEADNITVFVCSNYEWDALPAGSLDYLMSDQGTDKLRVILRHQIYGKVMEIADLINERRIISRANTHIPVRVSPVGGVYLGEDVRVVQADIPARNGLYYHLSKLLLPSDIYTFLPHRCNTTVDEQVKGPCGSCHWDLQCPEPTDIPTDEVGVDCMFSLNMGGMTTPFDGCNRICNRTWTKLGCCEGFHGDECQPCPGGFVNQCNGNGQCEENGTCTCKDGYTGPACDQCEDNTMFGENCTQPCTCQFGECNNGPKGTGHCKRGTCTGRRLGPDCDMKRMLCYIDFTVRMCHIYSECVQLNKTTKEIGCVCRGGYEGDGKTCTPYNPCRQSDRGGCHLQATCKYLGPGISSCQCDHGWVGTGRYCLRGTQCDAHRDCHEHAKCRLKMPDMKTLCHCKMNFHGNGTHCVPNNMCRWNMGGCHPKADCTPTGPGINNCTCHNGYAGDGYGCVATMPWLIDSTPALSKLSELLMALTIEEKTRLAVINTTFTLFAPSNEAMGILLSRISKQYWKKQDSVRLYLLSHLIVGGRNTDNLLPPVDGYDKLQTLFLGFYLHLYNDNNTLFVSGRRTSNLRSKVLESHEAANGFIHIIDRDIDTFFTADESPDIGTFFSQNLEYSHFGNLLKKKGVWDEILDMTSYTMFAPKNKVSSKYYDEKSVSRAFLRYHILPNIRLTESFDNGDRLETILGSLHPLRIMIFNDMIAVNGVMIDEPDVLTAKGIVHGMNGIFAPVLHRCDLKNTTTAFGDCTYCGEHLRCPDGYRIRTSARGLQSMRCHFKTTLNKYMLGCSSVCERSQYTKRCCANFYGPDCRECPGGTDFPCNHNGDCQDGLDNNGTCVCYQGYSGEACQFCEDNGTVLACGRSCDFNHGGCSAHADCEELSGQSTCTCKLGYIGDGNSCDVPCDVRNGGCHHNASCQFVATTGFVNCTCPDVMAGDGRDCFYPTVISERAKDDQSDVVVGLTLGILAVIALIVAATVVFLKIKNNSTGVLEVWSKVRRHSDSSCAQLHINSDDDATSVSQPLSPTEVNFDNPLYNVSDDF